MKALTQTWDVIVVGTGMGGATLGHALAAAGRSVLFLERGRSHLAGGALLGTYPESTIGQPWADAGRLHQALARGGRWHEPVRDLTRRRNFTPMIGCGSGGSSALYGMALERLHPADFEPHRHHRADPEAALPEAWPLAYAELEPYYRQAEVLYRVRGGPDPLRPEDTAHLLPPPPLAPAQQALSDFLASRGLHPYRLHLACEHLPDCTTCQGYLCPRACKNDSARICLAPALERHGAMLLDGCRVEALAADATRVTAVHADHRGQPLSLRARVVVLAAGALQTPLMLLRSASSAWPRGLANASDLVGRHLMRHYVDLYVLPAEATEGLADKALACSDFYLVEGRKLGSLQSFGALPPAALLVENLRQELRQGPMPWLAGPIALARPALTAWLGRRLARGLILASVMEDLPYADNRVEPKGEGTAIRYRIRPQEQARIAEMRRRVRAALAPARPWLIRQAENNAQLAHACGTCRFGTDPRTSVLDPDCRAHGLDNLYVADASVFPSSGGANPALTVAANALRVAGRIHDRL